MKEMVKKFSIKELQNSLRIVGSKSKDLSFCSRWNCWCPFLATPPCYDPILGCLQRLFCGIYTDYFHFFLIYLDRPVSVSRSPGINYYLFSFVYTFRSKYHLSYHSVKSSRAALWPLCVPRRRESKALSSANLKDKSKVWGDFWHDFR